MRKTIKEHDDRNEPGPMAVLVMVVSALLVAALVAYMVYQAVTAPSGGEPQAEVVSTSTTPEGDLRVEVAVTNQAERGLREVVVEVDCEEPPPEMTLMNVPAQGQRRGVLMCPPDAQDVNASIASYIWT